MGLGELVNLSTSEKSGVWGAAVESSSAHSLNMNESHVTVMFQSLAVIMNQFFSFNHELHLSLSNS